jgi:hypothetical protein
VFCLSDVFVKIDEFFIPLQGCSETVTWVRDKLTVVVTKLNLWNTIIELRRFHSFTGHKGP